MARLDIYRALEFKTNESDDLIVLDPKCTAV